MGIFTPKPGTVYLYSKSDKRWNVHLERESVGFGSEDDKELKDKLKLFKELYGKPPGDLEIGWEKY